MALVSPGTQLTVTDESQYVPGAVGTVPLVILATAQDKLVNGLKASATSKANAGTLQSFGSQRELVASLGYPIFKQSAAGTPLHGNELNEYGLMATYSALGLGNNAYVVRADIDLNQLEKTAVRPTGKVNDGTLWLDLTNTTWGIYEWDFEDAEFMAKTPLVINKSTDTTTGPNNLLAPKESIGNIGDYAVVTYDANNPIYYKNYLNTWVLVGHPDWQNSWPTLTGTTLDPSLGTLSGNPVDITINTLEIAFTTGTDLASIITDINTVMSGTGVVAAADSLNRLVFYVDKLAASNGTNADGRLYITEQTPGTLASLGITAGNRFCPFLAFGTYAQVPTWHPSDVTPRPTGSVWIKTSAKGAGASLAVKKYSSVSDSFVSVPAPIYGNEPAALAELDFGGGKNIGIGSIYVLYDIIGDVTATLKPYIRTTKGETKVIGTNVSPTFISGDAFILKASTPASGAITPIDLLADRITIAGTTAAAVVSAILAKNIPYVTAAVEASGAVSITHTAGGVIFAENVVGTPLDTAGITINGTPNVRFEISQNSWAFSAFKSVADLTSSSYKVQTTTPYTAPDDGTLWYYGDAAVIDIMINNNGWKGYKTVSNDARGFDLTLTDANGVIVSATAPVSQTDALASPLVPGDLWLDSSNLEKFPALYRYNGVNWVAIDNTDSIDVNGIVFADARWDTDGSTNPISDALPPITSLLVSSYIDLDAPDYRLYPRGALLFNLRRSGFNVKQYVAKKFIAKNYPDAVSLPAQAGTWVTVSGLKDDGSPYMGHQAQRHMVVKAMKAAIAANNDIREDRFAFSLMCAPGYPELIPDMVALNNDRRNTAFIIGDTPFTLPAVGIQIVNWSNGVAGVYGDGIRTADPYLGVFYPHAVTTDVSGNEILQPASHMMLRTFIRSDNSSYQWFAPAGTRRGLIDNATNIGYLVASGSTNQFVATGVNQGLRDIMYQNAVNPITVLPGVGLVAFGQKTRNGVASALDRINVARLVNYIRTILANVGNGFLFEPNDKITRDQFKQIIESAINDLVAKRGIYDYLVVCDTSNNTPARIARNELYVDIAISPMKDVEFIYIPIRLKNPGDIGKIQ